MFFGADDEEDDDSSSGAHKWPGAHWVQLKDA